MFLCADANIEEFLRIFLLIDGNHYVIYVDPRCYLRKFLGTPYEGGHLTAWKDAFNSAMEKGRITVEKLLKKVKQQWAFVDFKRRLHFLQMLLVGMIYYAAILLTNFWKSIYPNLLSHYYKYNTSNSGITYQRNALSSCFGVVVPGRGVWRRSFWFYFYLINLYCSFFVFSFTAIKMAFIKISITTIMNSIFHFSRCPYSIQRSSCSLLRSYVKSLKMNGMHWV